MPLWLRILLSPFVLVASAILTFLAWLLLTLTDVAFALFGRPTPPRDTAPNASAASIVIPNWNGRDLLEKYLASVVAAAPAPHEIIVVDNASTDGSAEWIRANFPQVRVLALQENRGFGGGCNAGADAATHDIIVLLNNDMRVEPDFLAPLLAPFHNNPTLFAVSSQIFFSDPTRRREETGLVQNWWQSGNLRTRHIVDDAITEPFPCAYPGGGSAAVDRRKFKEIGQFDKLLRPFYLEDNEIGYLAWKRGWHVLYQPASRVFHEHRGTIGRKFSQRYINGVLKKNFALFVWKNIHDRAKLRQHFWASYLESSVSFFAGDSPERASFLGLWNACLQLMEAVASRWHARSLATISDDEAFRRPLGGYFRDRFLAPATAPEQPAVLFVSPYPICPPIHGGGVFMYNTVKELGARVPLHLLVLMDLTSTVEAHDELAPACRSMTFIEPFHGPQNFGSVEPHAVTEFWNRDVEWAIHRILYTQQVDVLQLDYTNMGQYAPTFHNLVVTLFEHDIYFQSIRRSLPRMRTLEKLQARFEYLRAFRYELETLPHFDQVQVCSPANRDYLLSFVPHIAHKVVAGLRAGVPAAQYRFHAAPRRPNSLLFLGSFRHLPNQIALDWFLTHVFPRVRSEVPEATLSIIGSEPPPIHALPGDHTNVELIGFVEDVRQPLRDYAVFVCPILTGSGVRVKLLEAFSAGIPVVSTRLGAEGLAEQDGEFCRLADDPELFARAIIELLRDPQQGSAMAERAYQEILAHWDTPTITARLVDSYRELLTSKRQAPTTS